MDMAALGAMSLSFFFLLIPTIMCVTLLLTKDRFVKDKPLFIVATILSVILCCINIVYEPDSHAFHRFFFLCLGLGSVITFAVKTQLRGDSRTCRYVLATCLAINMLFIFI
ncbi:MAG: hypothetical protein RR052_05320 [Oscillospiraceae bacterium]